MKARFHWGPVKSRDGLTGPGLPFIGRRQAEIMQYS
jgi:hypothetical protein